MFTQTTASIAHRSTTDRSATALAFREPLPAGPRSQLPLSTLGRLLFEQDRRALLLLTRDSAVAAANAAAMLRLSSQQALAQDLRGQLSVRAAGRWQPLARLLAQRAGFQPENDTYGFTLDDAPDVHTRLCLFPLDGAVPGQPLAWRLAVLDIEPLDLEQALQRRHRFTPAQARVAALLCQGQTPTQVASALGVKVSTVRTHMAALYGRTGTRRMVQLLSALLRPDA